MNVHLKEHWEQAKKEKVMSEVYYIIEAKHFRAKWELANSSQVNSYKQNVLWQNKKKTMRNVKKKKGDLASLTKFSKYICVWFSVRLMNIDRWQN